MAMAMGMQQQQSNGMVQNNPQEQPQQLQQQQHRHSQQQQSQPQQKGKGMDSVMFRQREQLRGLQSLLKTQNGDLSSLLGMQGMQTQDMQAAIQQFQLQQQQQQQQQGMQQQQGIQQQQGMQQQRPSSSSVVMQQMIQHQQQRQLQQQQQQQLQAAAASQANAPQSQMPIQAASFLPQDQGNTNGMMQQRSSLIQQQPPQLGMVGGSKRSSINGSMNPSISPAPVPSGMSNQPAAMMNTLSTDQQRLISGGGIVSSDTTSGGSQPRVIPVSIAPGGKEGGVSDAALVYTKYAVDAIIKSLNSKKEKYGGAAGKEYTARDLSTCLGAWDLSVRHSSNKRARLEEKPPMDNNAYESGDADNAFNFYYERSCPILLNAKRCSGPMPFCVDDFGSSSGMDQSNDDGDLPDVVGAVVLTYGADSKFTGGVGEEGVLTKAIIEFFFDPQVVLSGTEYEGKEVTNAAAIEAEEQLFTQSDPDIKRSALLMAAMTALTPSASNGSTSMASSDDGVYTPTIWSGNTEREYKYCLLSTLNDKGQESGSKHVCVAIQNKSNTCAGDKGPAKGVCRITLTLSPASVQAKKKLMAKEDKEDYDHKTSSSVHRNIRDNIRLLRPPKLTSVSNDTEEFDVARPQKRRRQALRRTSISKLIDPTLIAVGIRCKHELLLDDDEVGKVYVNGTLVADCNLIEQGSTSTSLNRIPNADALPAHLLFGVDFTLSSHSGLPNKSVLEREYGFLLMDALITPHPKADVVGKVLNRLISGKTEGNEAAGSDDDDANQNDIKFDTTSIACFESIVLSSGKVDPVGISAKSLGTKFRMQYGTETFPCEIGTDEQNRLHKLIGAQKVAKLVPSRARSILRRGGYLGLDQMAAFIWTSSASSWDGDHNESVRAAEAIEKAIQIIQQVGCHNISPHNIRFVSRKQLGPAGDVSKLRSWYDSNKEIYYISDAILFQEEATQECLPSDTDKSTEQAKESDEGSKEAELQEKIDNGLGEEENEGKVSDEKDKSDTMDKRQEEEQKDQSEDINESEKGGKLQPEDEITKSSTESEKSGPTAASVEDAAYLLAFYIAKEHPDVMMLDNFIKSQRTMK